PRQVRRPLDRRQAGRRPGAACPAAAGRASRRSAPGRRLVSRADLADPATMAKWLDDLRTGFDDLDATVQDMLRPPGERELGPVLHAQHHADARAKILAALDYAG